MKYFPKGLFQKIVMQSIIWLLLALLLYLTSEIFERETSVVDTNVYSIMISFRTSLLTDIMVGISFVGEQIAVVLATLLIIIYLVNRSYANSLLIFLAIFLASTVTYFLKILTARPRPDMMFRLVTENNFSFPSGHATIAFTVYPILLILFCRSQWIKDAFPKWLQVLKIVILILIPIFVSISRMYLGVHYFSDVVAGAIIGLFFSYIFAILSYKKPAI
jgi:undecaprenyl-diphosphatase